jgi:hypothetical protein
LTWKAEHGNNYQHLPSIEVTFHTIQNIREGEEQTQIQEKHLYKHREDFRRIHHWTITLAKIYVVNGDD